jgi:hypothetical protein
MPRIALLSVLAFACNASDEAAFDQAPPPPFDFDLTVPSVAQPGDVLPVQITIPPGGRRNGYSIDVFVSNGGPGAICPTPTDCLDITGNFIQLGSVPIRGGVGATSIRVPQGVSSTLQFQAIRIQPSGGAFYSNDVAVDVLEGCVDDGYEPDSSPATAIDAVLPSVTTQVVCDGDDDFVSVDLAEGEMLRVDATFLHAEGDVDLFVHRADATNKYEWEAASFSSTDNESIRFVAPEAGTYLVRAELYAEGGDSVLGASYDLDIAVGTTAGEDFDGDGCPDLDDRHLTTPSAADDDLDGIGNDCDTFGDIAGVWSGAVIDGSGPHIATVTLGLEGASGDVVGTVSYGAPVSCTADLTQSSESGDLYTFGQVGCSGGDVLLTYNAATGSLSFSAQSGGSNGTLARISARDVMAGRWSSGDSVVRIDAGGSATLGERATVGGCAASLVTVGSSGLTVDATGDNCQSGTIGIAYDPIADTLLVDDGSGPEMLTRDAYGHLAGFWTGTFVEGAFTYPMEMTLQADADFGADMGEVNYPTYGCTGSMPRNAETDLLTTETAEQHAFGCVSGPVTMVWDPATDTIDYEFRRTSGSLIGTATLTR